MLNTNEAALYADTTPLTIRREVKRGNLKAITNKKNKNTLYQIDESELDKWIKKYKTPRPKNIHIKLTDNQFNLLLNNIGNDSFSSIIGELIERYYQL